MKIALSENIEDSKLFYIMLAVGCMNFLGKGSVVFLVFCFLCIPEIANRKLHLDISFFFTLALTLTILISSLIYYTVFEAVKSVICAGVYFIAYNVYRLSENREKFVKQSIFAIFLGFFANMLITYIYNIGLERPSLRSLYSFWTKELMSVTLVGLLSSVVIGYSFYCLFCTDSVFLKILSLSSLIITLLLNIDTATRTPAALLLLVYSLMLVIYLTDNKNKTLYYLMSMLFTSAVLMIVYFCDFFGFRSYILSSPMLERLAEEGLETGRFQITAEHFLRMTDHPWGGGFIGEVTGYSAHNYLQEAYDLYGIFAALSLVGLTFTIAENVFLLIRKKDKTSVDFLFISMYISMFVQSCLEPVFTGFPVLVWSLLFVHGLASSYLKCESEEAAEQRQTSSAK